MDEGPTWVQRHPVLTGFSTGLLVLTGYAASHAYLVRTWGPVRTRRFFRRALIKIGLSLLLLVFFIYIAGPAAGPPDSGYNPFAAWFVLSAWWMFFLPAGRIAWYACREGWFRSRRAAERYLG